MVKGAQLLSLLTVRDCEEDWVVALQLSKGELEDYQQAGGVWSPIVCGSDTVKVGLTHSLQLPPPRHLHAPR